MVKRPCCQASPPACLQVQELQGVLQAQTLLRGSIEGQGSHQVSVAAAQLPAAACGTSSKSICCDCLSPGLGKN